MFSKIKAVLRLSRYTLRCQQDKDIKVCYLVFLHKLSPQNGKRRDFHGAFRRYGLFLLLSFFAVPVPYNRRLYLFIHITVDFIFFVRITVDFIFLKVIIITRKD